MIGALRGGVFGAWSAGLGGLDEASVIRGRRSWGVVM